MMSDRLRLLQLLYGKEPGLAAFEGLEALIRTYRSRIPQPVRPGLDHSDAMLITYPDQVQEPGRLPLRSLAEFCERYLSGLVSCLHILPFYPYSSDDGFSVIDYLSVEPDLGGWEDIARLGQNFRLMFDAVINHISAQSAWFQAFLRDDPRYRDYFIVVEGQPDLAQVVRPRALPLLTPFVTPSGEKRVWTTFSADQVDLNYANPQVLLNILRVLLEYVAHGAQFIRLDAIAYLWKEPETSSIHRPQTHWIIRLMRAVLDELAPHVLLITETNVPHLENISYFGDGSNEAQLVYNFALPPLVLHAFATGNAETLSAWAAGLSLPSPRTTFFNFLASHDGIGLSPARGILTDSEIDSMAQRVGDQGGLISYRHNPDGSQSPYELNINYFDALGSRDNHESLSTQINRYMVSQAVMLSLIGLPGIYFHSLFGSRGWLDGVSLTGHNRTINRQKLDRLILEQELSDSTSLRAQVFRRYIRLLSARASAPAFDPYGEQHILDCGRAVFAIVRFSKVSNEPVICLHNISNGAQKVNLDLEILLGTNKRYLRDLVAGSRFSREQLTSLELSPYQILWMAPMA